MLRPARTYWILPGPNRVTITLLPRTGTYFTVGIDERPVQSVTCGEIGRSTGQPLRIAVHSPDRVIAARVDLDQGDQPVRCHLYFKPGGPDWVWSGAPIAGDNSTIFAAGTGPFTESTIAFCGADRPNAPRGTPQFPSLDSFRVSLLDHGLTGNMIFRGNLPLAPAPENAAIDFDTLHETLKLTYFAQTGRQDFPEKGCYVLRVVALLDAVEEKGMLLRELMSFGGKNIARDLDQRGWFPPTPAAACASGILAQMSYWPVPPAGAFAAASQGVLREAAAKLRAWIGKRESLPHIYYVHCSDGQERAGLIAARYLLIHHKDSDTASLFADDADPKWKLTDLFRIPAWAHLR